MAQESQKTTQLYLNTMSSILDRLLIAASYGALQKGTAVLGTLTVTAATRDIFQVASTFFFFLLAIKFRTLEGLQNVLVMICAQGFSASMPLPQEPTGILVLPAILLYFGGSALVMEYAYRFGLIKDNADTTTTKTIQYLVLFVGARGLARFQALAQNEILGVLSMIYLMLPAKLTSVQYKPKSALDFFVQIVDCLANRGIVLWLIAKIERFTGVSSLFPYIFFFLGVLMWNPVARAPKLETCVSVFSFFTARQIVQLIQERLSDVVCAVLLTSMLTCMLLNGDGSSALANMVMVGLGVVFTNWLDKWIHNWSQHSDWMIVYLLVFVILETVGRQVRRGVQTQLEKTAGGSKKNEQTTILENSSLSGASSNLVAAIAHHHALLGLPRIDDASGSH